jgi:RHS repeat-associated protein
MVSNPANPVIPAEYYTFGFDQVKNVTELFDASGNIAASYDYAPFGATLSASGPAAALNPFRFSSEVWDATLGLVCYIFRPYNPLDGRFINRDPIEEQGGLNLYGFAGNNPVNKWDYLGLEIIKVPKCHAVLIIGHTNEKSPIQWEFPKDGCAYGGVVGCWPDVNNPTNKECRWPSVPFLNTDRMFSGGRLRDLFDLQSRQKDSINEDFTDQNYERNPNKAVDNVWSKIALDTIKDKLCGDNCCCEEITFSIRITKGDDDLRDAVKKFNWQRNSVRKIKFSCNK